MVVFCLDSDKYFVQNNYKDTGVRVYQYEEYTNLFGMIHANCPRWTLLGEVTALELFGVTITNEGLATLARDLIINGRNGEKFNLLVNRQGVCFVDVNQNYLIQWMRINGLFCWSKYGVVKPEPKVTEASDGADLSRPLAIG